MSEMSEELEPVVPPAAFETVYDEGTRFPFFESDYGAIIGGGHHDKNEFAALVTKYDRLTESRSLATTADEVEWRYALVSMHGGDRWFVWEQDGERVTSTMANVIAITLVER